MAVLLDGKKVSEKVLAELKPEIEEINRRLFPRKLRLDIVMVGDHAPSLTFVNRKKKVGEGLGILVKVHHIAKGMPPEELTQNDVSSAKLNDIVHRICKNRLVHGMLVQLPLPKYFDEQRTQSILNVIPESKDVDVLGKEACGKFYTETELILPSTLAGILKLLEEYGINDFVGKNVAVVGAGKLVGKPVINYLLRKDIGTGTVSTVRSRSPDKVDALRRADIIISGAGNPETLEFIKGDMVKPGAVIVDAASAKDPKTGKLKGDVDFASVEPKASYITPVPGGVGPMTVAMIFYNLVQLANQRYKSNDRS